MIIQRVCVYCGSSNRVAPHFLEAATEVGATLARRGLGVVYGGGQVGLMGRLADAALAAGGEVFGVIPRKLMDLELGHEGCTELHVVDGMQARKLKMATLADAFIALPGGVGTLEELFEALSWTQLNYHHKAVGVLNVAGYFDRLLRFLDHARDEGFVEPRHRDLLCASADLGELLSQLQAADIPDLSTFPQIEVLQP